MSLSPVLCDSSRPSSGSDVCALMNLRFVVRALIAALLLATLIVAGWVFLQTPFRLAAGPTPRPPTIREPRGPVPAGPVGLRELVQYQGGGYHQAGSGFFLQLDNGEVIGVTTAHSLTFCDPNRPLERIAFATIGATGHAVEFDTLRGPPGRLLTVDDMTVDYALLQVDHAVEPALLLQPDPRGQPQPGERVTLYSGVEESVREGTVHLVTDTAVWVLMDDWFDPGLMSGSPFVSQHTGKVVGMAVAASPRRNRLLLGVHPIGSIVNLAYSAKESLKFDELCAPE